MIHFKDNMWITMSVFILFIDDVTGTCSGQVYKKTIFEGILFKDWTSAPTVGSIRECGEKCTTDTECQSFGINLRTLQCYLYNILIWSGGLGAEEPNMVYYWAYQKTCPTDQAYIDNVQAKCCYRYYAVGLGWTDAMKQCSMDNGHLYLGDTKQKVEIAIRYLPEVGYAPHWLGSTDVSSEGTWNWLNGETVNSSGWGRGSPDNYRDTDHCMANNANGFFDGECTDKFHFMCEIPVV
ncbi:CD209 antigen-like protein E [Patella vulgata]|uniref:CD209 antigen-like protein E n=1 Tax=Patella vulgata TaxID=6465 RepID=UPI0021803DC2|nr:CD209 antigen-like protein E [Patella vulgata]